MEYWNIGRMGDNEKFDTKYSIIPAFQSSKGLKYSCLRVNVL